MNDTTGKSSSETKALLDKEGLKLSDFWGQGYDY